MLKYQAFLWRVLFSVALIGITARSAAAQIYEGIDLGLDGDGSGLSFAMESANRPFFTYFNSNTRALKSLRASGTSWITEIIDGTLSQTSDTEAVVTADGAVHVFYANTSTGQLWHAVRGATNWIKDIVDGAASGGTISAALCGGQICLSYYDTTNKNQRFARGTTGTWQTENTDISADDVGSESSIAVDSSGRIVIAYYDATNKRLKVAWKTTGAWTIELPAHPGALFGSSPKVAISSDGTIHAAAGEVPALPAISDQGLYYLKRPTSGGWTVVRVSRAYTGGANAIQVKPNGSLEIAARYLRANANYGNWSSARLRTLDVSGVWQESEYSGAFGAAGAIYTYKNFGLDSDPWGSSLVTYNFSRAAHSGSPPLAAIRLHRPLDSDSDRLPDTREQILGTNPFDFDTDEDGLGDGDEVMIYGSDPLSSVGGTTTTTTSTTTTTTAPTTTTFPTTTTTRTTTTTTRTTTTTTRATTTTVPTTTTTTPVQTTTSTTTTITTTSTTATTEPPIAPREDQDSDGDGLTDVDEAQMGTNPLKPDTDGDLVSDGQEVLDGTNPLDRGSYLQVLGKSICTAWNRAGATWNMLELLNVGITKLKVATKIYGGGRVIASRACTLSSGASCSVAVHDLVKKARASRGMVCASHDGAAGSLDGRLIFYKTSSTIRSAGHTRDIVPAAAVSGFDFGYALSLENPKPGAQFIPFATAGRLGKSKGLKFSVSSSATVLNPSGSPVHGRLIVRERSGTTVREISVTAPAFDVAVISNKKLSLPPVGQLEWRPDDFGSEVRVTLEQSINQSTKRTMKLAGRFILEGLSGTGEASILQLDGSFFSTIGITNTRAEQNGTTVDIYNASGASVRSFTVDIAPYATHLLPVEQFLGTEQGSIRIRGRAAAGLVAFNMAIGRSKSGAVQNSYVAPAEEALGTILSGPYDTTRKQISHIIISNTLDRAESLTVAVRRSASLHIDKSGAAMRPDRTHILTGQTFTLPPHATLELPVSSFEGAGAVGAITVQPAHPNSIVGWIRQHKGKDYVLITPLRQ